MTNPVTEAVYSGEFILSEGPRSRSRDTVTIAQNQTVLAGSVLGLQSVGTLAGAFAALGTNTGTPTCGAITVAPGTETGEFDIIMDDATHFHVMQPPSPGLDTPGEEIGHGVIGSAFSAGGLGFTLTAGVACVPGDSFKITVTQSGAVNQYVLLNPSATDGSQNAAAIALFGVVTGASQTAKITAITRQAEVKSGMLGWNGATTPQIAAATLQLAALGIIVR